MVISEMASQSSDKQSDRVIQLFATLAAIGLAIVAVLFVLQDRLIIAGTLLVLTSFMIYIRETHKRSNAEGTDTSSKV